MAAEFEFLQRLLLSMAAGALIGIEREYTKHQETVGMRSFALVSLLGCLSVLLSQPILFPVPVELPLLPYIGLIAVLGYAFLIYYFLAKKDFFGITTTLSLPLAYLFGMLIGYGFFVVAIIGAVVTTLLLYSRRYSHLFVQQLTDVEVTDALQFAIVLFIAYPMLSDVPLTLFGLDVPLKKFVEIIIILSLISFSGFLAVRFLGQKAIPLTGFFAGFVSALAVTMSFSARSRQERVDNWVLCAGIAAANMASLLGDIIVLLYISVPLLIALYPTYIVMLLILLVASLPFFSHRPNKYFTLSLGQPFSVMSGLKFALAFVVIMLATQYIANIGTNALYLASFLAGIVSITSVVVSLSLQASAGTLPVNEAARGVFLATAGGWLAKAVVVAVSASPALRRRAFPLLVVALLAGIAALLLTVH